jgi:hypothetical protein
MPSRVLQSDLNPRTEALMQGFAGDPRTGGVEVARHDDS